MNASRPTRIHSPKYVPPYSARAAGQETTETRQGASRRAIWESGGAIWRWRWGASCIAHRSIAHRASNIGGRAIRLTMGRWMRCAAVHGAQSHSLRLTGAPIEPASTHIHLHLHLTDGIDRARAILLRSFARVRSTVFLRAVRIASPAPNRPS